MNDPLTRSTRPNQREDMNGDWHYYNEECEQQYQTLFHFLCRAKYENGSKYAGGTFSIYVREGQLCFRMYDKSTEESGFGTVKDPKDIIGSLNWALENDAVEWRQVSDRKQRGGQAYSN